ncbi:ATP-binding protein [Novacetimonas pomaceti]|uniref:ATP-binding protein n=1 Tax=Novacetimonas pomaceti TaxID=2021998 RepID=UPI001C2D68C5|nr:ATP-binding protein [Novacetimonas pomaceti]MBV1833058.1 ATP-binding protein [Novacetimonas pomaceti]
MNMLSRIQTGVVHRPPRLLVYGPHGIGKTSLAAGAPDPILIQTEEGADEIGIPRFPLAQTFEDMMEAMAELSNNDHQFRSCILDSVDWAERLVWDYTCRQNGWTSIEQPGYGKGYIAALENWFHVLNMVNAMRDRGMAVIMLAHTEVKHFDDPTTDGYDRYQPALHKAASAKVQEAADAVLFMNWKIVTDEKKEGFGRKITKGMGNGSRQLFTEERPAALAKNRFSMPYRIDLPAGADAMWPAVAAHIPYFNAQ